VCSSDLGNAGILAIVALDVDPACLRET